MLALPAFTKVVKLVMIFAISKAILPDADKEPVQTERGWESPVIHFQT